MSPILSNIDLDRSDQFVDAVAEVREFLNDLSKPVVRWLGGGVLGLIMVLLVTTVVEDRKVDVRELVGIAVGALVLSLLALLATFALGDGVRVIFLRCTGGGFADPDRCKLAHRLTVRVLLLSAALLVLLLVGPSLMIATNPQASAIDRPVAPAKPTPTRPSVPRVLD